MQRLETGCAVAKQEQEQEQDAGCNEAKAEDLRSLAGGRQLYLFITDRAGSAQGRKDQGSANGAAKSPLV